MYAEQLDRFSTVAAAVAVTVAVDSELATVVLRVAHGVMSLAVVEYNVCSANLKVVEATVAPSREEAPSCMPTPSHWPAAARRSS